MLTKGQPYYFEFPFFDYGGGYYAEMGVLMDQTKRTASQVKGAYNEKQKVKISSIYNIDKQVRAFTDSSNILFAVKQDNILVQ